MKKGFTLVELAIVLVVIGVLLGMAIKGRALMEVAQIKADVNKVQKITSGYAIYFSKFNKRPGEDNKAWSMMDNLTKEGSINDADFNTKLGDGYWALVPCASTTGELWDISATGTSMCLAVVTAKPTSGGDAMVTETSMKALSPQFICYLEAALDNKDINTGDGRSTAKDKPALNGGTWDCATLPDDASKGNKYLYRIF